MFALDLEELRSRKILDVASGPGSFVAEALAMGLDATGCDPMYAQDAATVAAQERREPVRGRSVAGAALRGRAGRRDVRDRCPPA